MSTTIHGLTKQVTEWNYISHEVRSDPFNEIELDIIITHEDGESWTVPVFWAGAEEWKVRFSAPKYGVYTAISICSDVNDNQLHQVSKKLSITHYEGDNPLYKHGPLQINTSKGYFEHADATPFFWLGDTWWMGLCKRLSWPEDFKELTADRVQKGFSVIQIVAGLYPDMDSFDERGANEAGFPWEKDYATINPAYFDAADMRIAWLVHSGLIPCILGSWGYYLFSLGIDKMKQHWRYIIARWGAYSVIWSLAGETAMPYYLSKNKDIEQNKLREGWTEIGHYIKKIDPYTRLLTVHPTQNGRDQITDESIMDFNMVQTGHSGCRSVKNTLNVLSSEAERKPKMPIVIGEVNYEGIVNSNHEEVQRLTFWSAVISGANGFTYGANGVWQVNQDNKPFGNSPTGRNWGNTPWRTAYSLNGGRQLGLAKRLLQNYDWWNFEFHPEWVSIKGNPNDITVPLATGIAKKIRIVYYFGPKFLWNTKPFKIRHFLYCLRLKALWIKKTFKILNLESDVEYKAFFWNPRNADKHNIGIIQTNHHNEWQIPKAPSLNDWVLILEAQA